MATTVNQFTPDRIDALIAVERAALESRRGEYKRARASKIHERWARTLEDLRKAGVLSVDVMGECK